MKKLFWLFSILCLSATAFGSEKVCSALMRVNDSTMSQVLEFNIHPETGGLFAQVVLEGVTFEVYSPIDSENLVMTIYGKDNIGFGTNVFPQLGKYTSVVGTISGKTSSINCLLK